MLTNEFQRLADLLINFRDRISELEKGIPKMNQHTSTWQAISALQKRVNDLELENFMLKKEIENLKKSVDKLNQI